MPQPGHVGPSWVSARRSRAVAGACLGQRDDLVDHAEVGLAGDDRDGQRVAGGYLGVLAGEVSSARVGGLAERGPEPGVLQVGRTGQLTELADGYVHDDLGVGAARSGTSRARSSR